MTICVFLWVFQRSEHAVEGLKVPLWRQLRHQVVETRTKAIRPGDSVVAHQGDFRKCSLSGMIGLQSQPSYFQGYALFAPDLPAFSSQRKFFYSSWEAYAWLAESIEAPRTREDRCVVLADISPKLEDIALLDNKTRILTWLSPLKLQERAEAAAKQMRYFRLFSQRGSFGELEESARRAGFEVIGEDAFGLSLCWAATVDHPDFTFRVSRDALDTLSVTAESCQRDILGLVMTSNASEPMIAIEAKRSLEEHRLGRNADQFRKIMLTFPDFDDGMEQFLRSVRPDQPFMPTGFP